VIVVMLLLPMAIGYIRYAWFRWRTLPRYYRENEAFFQQTVVLDDIGFVIKDQLRQEFAFSWDDYRGWHVDDSQIVLFELEVERLRVKRTPYPIPPRFALHPLPRHFFTDSQWYELRSFLEQRFAASQPVQIPLQTTSAATSREVIRTAMDGVKAAPSDMRPKPDGAQDGFSEGNTT
jgi:hypothetical protein